MSSTDPRTENFISILSASRIARGVLVRLASLVIVVLGPCQSAFADITLYVAHRDGSYLVEAARVIRPALARELGQSVSVEIVDKSSISKLLRLPSDGSAILLADLNLDDEIRASSAPIVGGLMENFAFIEALGERPLVLIVNPATGINEVSDLTLLIGRPNFEFFVVVDNAMSIRCGELLFKKLGISGGAIPADDLYIMRQVSRSRGAAASCIELNREVEMRNVRVLATSGKSSMDKIRDVRSFRSLDVPVDVINIAAIFASKRITPAAHKFLEDAIVRARSQPGMTKALADDAYLY